MKLTVSSTDTLVESFYVYECNGLHRFSPPSVRTVESTFTMSDELVISQRERTQS